MTKPIIGLTTTRIIKRSMPPAFGANEPYSKSILDAGGLPVLIPANLSDEDLLYLLSQMDGILLTGGYDIDPRIYGNPSHPKVQGIDADRDHTEITLIKLAIRSKKPFLGICRGCQVINVALGGTLYEDLPEQFGGEIRHDNHDHPRDYLAHPVMLQPLSPLTGILGRTFVQVNSLHHQGINRLSPDLIAAAHAPDELIEAVELPSYRFGMAVQWHPEELQEYESMRQLFRAFVQNCSL